jgi:hypothetical protein
MLDFHKFNNLSSQKRCYSTLSPKNKTNMVSQPDLDFSILQALGLDPSHVNIQASLRDKPIH